MKKWMNKGFWVFGLALVPGFIGCGGEASDDAPAESTAAIETEPSENRNNAGESASAGETASTGETATTEEASCTSPGMDGVLRVGEEEISLSDTTVSISGAHSAECLGGLDIEIAYGDDCALRFSASAMGESGWAITSAEADSCESLSVVDGESFWSAGSSFGLLASPDTTSTEELCLSGESLTIVGRVAFGNEAVNQVIRLDGLTVSGSFTSALNAELKCPAMVETCAAQTCGEDSFGVVCGGCDDGFKCIDGNCSVWNCPPQGPYGTEIGETVLNIQLKDCDGNLHSLQDLCGAPAGYFNLLAGF
jgi:hypothetical protein